MCKEIDMHLKSVSAQELKKFKKEAFVLFSSTSRIIPSNGIVQLGIDGNGMYCVKTSLYNESTSFKNPLDAVKEYQKLARS